MKNNMENYIGPGVFGWKSIEEAADEIYSGVNRRLLEGIPVFTYKSLTEKPNFKQVVVVRNIDYKTGRQIDSFGVGIITSTWTALYPQVPYEYLETDLRLEMKDSKIEESVLKMYDQIISRLKENEK